jgi:hypothetical protein
VLLGAVSYYSNQASTSFGGSTYGLLPDLAMSSPVTAFPAAGGDEVLDIVVLELLSAR